MNITQKNLTQFPQTVEIPEPLEIHPSVDPELAKGLIAAIEHIEDHPEEFDMEQGFNSGPGTKGCIMCHAERLSNWRRDGSHILLGHKDTDPVGHVVRIYSAWHWMQQGFLNGYGNTAGRIARVEHFLRTGL